MTLYTYLVVVSQANTSLLIVYLVVLIYLRIMGKRQLGEMQPFELVVTLLIADIASLPMTQTSMPLLFSLIPLTAIVVLHFFVLPPYSL